MYEAVETSRLTNAILSVVPDTFVRDYIGGGGFLQIRRREKIVYSHDSDESYRVPAETLCILRPGWTPRSAIMAGAKMLSPGWQIEMRKMEKHIEPEQREAIERAIGFPIFRKARGD